MKLHIANKNYSSWSLRPWVLMTTLGLPFEESVHPFPVGGGATGFDTFSPSGKVPVLQDGEQVIWDTLAIAEYLAEQHPQVWPTDRQRCPRLGAQCIGRDAFWLHGVAQRMFYELRRAG